jgi:hypothetical protein
LNVQTHHPIKVHGKLIASAAPLSNPSQLRAGRAKDILIDFLVSDCVSPPVHRFKLVSSRLVAKVYRRYLIPEREPKPIVIVPDTAKIRIAFV